VNMNGNGTPLLECTIEIVITANIVNYGEINTCINKLLL